MNEIDLLLKIKYKRYSICLLDSNMYCYCRFLRLMLKWLPFIVVHDLRWFQLVLMKELLPGRLEQILFAEAFENGPKSGKCEKSIFWLFLELHLWG